MQFQTLDVSLEAGVAHLRFNRPEKSNALNERLWFELRDACRWADETPAVRVVILSGKGRNFCSGIDLSMLGELQQTVLALPPGQRHEVLRHRIRALQECVSALEACRKPVIAQVHGACFGGGIDLITACDLRHATADARFCVKEIDVAIVADVGTLQRLPRIVGEGFAREMALTGREYRGTEVAAMGLVTRIHPDVETLETEVAALAASMAGKSPLAMRGTKESLNFSRDHTVAEGLAEVAARNAGLLFSPDIEEAIAAQRTGRPPRFAD